MDLSIVIVNYNVKFFLEQCLISVHKAVQDINAEIFVVDNNSVDGSVQMVKEKFPEVKLIINETNAGFSKANNQAIKQSSGKHVLLLNPDTLIEVDTLKKVLYFAEKTPDAGGVGVKMIDGKGQFLPESKRGLPTPAVAFYKIFGLSRLFPRSKKFGKYHLSYLSNDRIHQVDILSGAFMLLRREALMKTGLLDETFFMYGEDIDLSYRIIKAGYKNYYYPETRIIHYKGESTKKSSVNYVFVFYNAMVIFARKHFSKKNAKVFSLLIHLAIYLRAAIALTSRFFKHITMPLCDGVLIFAGILGIKIFWQQNMLNYDFQYYPQVFTAVFVPAYILIWLFSVYYNGGYEKPVKLSKSIQGIIAGTLIILVIYALLPESWRFSRALIILGSLWAIIAVSCLRVLFHYTGMKDFRLGTQDRRIAIIGNKEETDRTSLLLNQFSKTPEIVGAVSYQNHYKEAIGHFEQIKDIVEIYKINEIIFCAKDIPYDKIIDKMSALRIHDVNFKIIPPESLFIVGSNSIEASDSFFTISINPINKSANLRKKYTADILLAFFFLILSPLLLFINKHKANLFKNIFHVLILKKTWVGYAMQGNDSKLPKLKKGILSPLDGFKSKNINDVLAEKINLMYARNYKLTNDITIIFKNLNHLSRKN